MGTLTKYIGKRLLQLIPVVLGITFLSFAMMRMAGSDAVMELYGDKGAVAQEIMDAKRAELGLDQPFLIQYGSWLKGLLTATSPGRMSSIPLYPNCRPRCC